MIHPAQLPGPKGLPLLGNAPQLDQQRVHQTLEAWARQYGSLYRVKFGRRPFVVTTEPELIAEVLRKRPDTYRRIDRMELIFDELGVAGVFSAEGAPWRAQRKLAMRALDNNHLNAFFATLLDVAKHLHQRWEAAADKGDVLDVVDEMMRFTIDVTTRLAFAEETDTIGGKQSTLLDDIDGILPGVSRRLSAAFPYWRLFRLPRDRKLDRSIKQLRAWLGELIERTRADLKADPSRAEAPRNFLEAMLVATDADGKPFSNEIVFGNAITMLLAGEDTTANTLAWAVHFLLDSPAELSALRTHIDQVLGDARVPTDMAMTRTLEDIESVANETMRLKPVAPILFLQNIPALTLGDLQLEPGTALILLTRVSGMDPKRIENPEVFRPNRWREGAIAAEMQRSGVFVPFGSGPRICPGRSLALLEIRVVLATLLRSFELERVGRSEDVEEVFGFTLTPTHLKVRLRRRTQF